MGLVSVYFPMKKQPKDGFLFLFFSMQTQLVLKTPSLLLNLSKNNNNNKQQTLFDSTPHPSIHCRNATVILSALGCCVSKCQLLIVL